MGRIIHVPTTLISPPHAYTRPAGDAPRSAGYWRLAQHGYDVAVNYRNKAARARKVVEAIEQEGQRGLALTCDITRAEDVQRFFQELQQWNRSPGRADPQRIGRHGAGSGGG